MRDKRFVAEHRGGPLTKDQHRQLILWACRCVENVLPLITNKVDQRLTNAIKVAKEWTKDNASVGGARNASFDAIAVANELTNPIEIAVARSVGHAVATAHMADHSLRAAEYALKAIKLADKSIDIEREFQDKNLSLDISELVISARNKQNIKANRADTGRTTNR
jgi:uncharacterized protein GlcG (DUF336 family)